MKFTTISDAYISPDHTKGIFPGAFIKDFRKTIEEDRLIVYFGLYFIKEEVEVKVNETSLLFDSNSQHAVLGINPTTDDEGNIIYEEVDLIEHLTNGGSLSDGEIIHVGYPTFEFVKSLFEGGSIDSPEIHLTEHPLKELAKGFLLEKVIFDMEPIKEQFKFE